MKLSPDLWGTQAWHFIHYVALSYPANPTMTDRANYLKFFESLGDVLPCQYCAKHFKEKMRKHPIKLNNKIELFEWTVDMHNIVNRENGKKEFTYKEAMSEINKKQFKDFMHSLPIEVLFAAVIALSFVSLLSAIVNDKN